MSTRERVLVRRVTTLARDVREALDFLEYDFAGKRVWLKPNLLSPHPPEHSVTTDPELVRALVHELEARGARSLIVSDSPSGPAQGPLEDFLAVTGIVAASEGHFRSAGLKTIPLKLKSRFAAEVRAPQFIAETDVILNLPVLKTHGLTLITGAIKNTFGIVVGGQKTHLHAIAPGAKEFAELIVDIYEAIPAPMLHIMDALRGMDGPMGPAGGRILKLNRLLAARNGVALDAVMCLLVGRRPQTIPMLRIAAERGLGPIQPEQIEIVGDFETIPGFQFPSAQIASGAGALSPLVYPLLRRRPVLIPERCTRCERCGQSCPVGAIAMKPLPRIDPGTCIACYCCSETCPERAYRIPGQAETILRNLFRR